METIKGACVPGLFPKIVLVRDDGGLSSQWEIGASKQDLCKYPAGHSQAQQTRASFLFSKGAGTPQIASTTIEQ